MEIFNKTTRKVKGPIRTDSCKEAHDLAVVLGAGIGFYSLQTSEGTVYTAVSSTVAKVSECSVLV